MTVSLNELGKAAGMPHNLRASLLCRADGLIRPEAWIAGPALVLAPGPDGQDSSVRPGLVEAIDRLADALARISR
jgi:hypothetical protein